MSVKANNSEFYREIITKTTNDFLDSLFKNTNKFAFQNSISFGSIEYDDILLQYRIIEKSCIKLIILILKELVSNEESLIQGKTNKKEVI